MKHKEKIFLYIAVLTTYLSHSQTNSSVNYIYKDIEFEMDEVSEPQFKDQEYPITDYGAVGDGLFKNTEVFKNVIAEAHDEGGGTVIVPEGIWLTGPITLKSNINLHLKRGALILFSDDFKDYALTQTSFEGLDVVRAVSPINALNAQNIAITGAGIVDGSGGSWRPVKKSKMTDSQWRDLVKSGGVLSENKSVWYPDQASLDASQIDLKELPMEAQKRYKSFLRPVLVSLIKCNTILLDGLTFQNSPGWNIHPLMSKNIILRNLTVRNPWYAQNGDGLDIESCENVLVYDNTFDVGDDAICIKSGKDEDGRLRNMPTTNVIIKNNTVYHGHGGFVVGSEMSGGVSNIHISHCNFLGTDTGLRFKSTRGRGGVVEKVYVSNIYMHGIKKEVIRFNSYYGGPIPDFSDDLTDKESAVEVMPVTVETPSFQNIHISNITAVNSNIAGFLMGLPEMNLKNITLKNSLFETEEGITLIDVDGLQIEDVQFITKKAPFQLHNTKNIQLDSVYVDSPDKNTLQVSGVQTKNIKVLNAKSKMNLNIKTKKIKDEITIN